MNGRADTGGMREEGVPALSGVDLNLLVLLDVLVEESSVTRAARRVGLSQSATSHALARLRSLLGDPLLVRSGRGMTPTARARQLAGPLRRALADLGAALAPPRPFDPARDRRCFTLALEEAGQAGLLPLLAGALALHQASGVSLRVVAGGGGAAESELADGRVDLALSVAPAPGRGLRWEPVFSTPYVTIARGEPEASERELGLKEFASRSHIALAGPASVDREIDRLLAARGLRRRVALEVPSLLAVPRVVAGSELVATVPALLLRLDREGNRLAVHRSPLNLPRVTGALVWHDRVHGDSGHQWLRSMVRETCRRLAVHGVPRD